MSDVENSRDAEPSDLGHQILSAEPPPTGKSEEPAPNAAMGFVSLLLSPLFRYLKK